MKRRGRWSLSSLICVSILVGSVGLGCAWEPWIPDRPPPKREVVVDPATLSEQLPLDVAYVDELSCYARRCQKRFRVVVDEPGQLTVRLIPDLAGPDAQAQLTLESVQAVLAQAGTGRGPRTDVPVVTVRDAVDPGAYFVLLQSLGGPMPYELVATHAPGAGATPAPAVELAQPALEQPQGDPPRLAEVELEGRAGASFDPAVSFSDLRTFTFPRPVRPGDPEAATQPLEQPIDRQIRRFLAADLELKGFRQARGGEPADLLVDFSTGSRTKMYYAIPLLYDWYRLGAPGSHYPGMVDERTVLTVDIIDNRSNRIAWHAWTEKGLGPGITYGEKSTALTREAVSDVLARFPPR